MNIYPGQDNDSIATDIVAGNYFIITPSNKLPRVIELLHVCARYLVRLSPFQALRAGNQTSLAGLDVVEQNVV